MRSVVCHALGPVEALSIEERPVPEVEAGRVRVAVAAAGTSYVTALQVAGRYQFPLAPPFVPGAEIAGVVDAVGPGVTEWRPGDRVFGSVGSGAFAEYVLAAPDQLLRLPDGVDFARGASMLQAYGTAWFALTRRTTVRDGEWMLVTGAGGGVGLSAVDVGRFLGARVVAVASSPEKRELARAAGADEVIDPLGEDVKLRARELTGGAGLGLVYDVAGGEVSEAALRALGPAGRLLVVGFAGGVPRIPLNLVLLRNRAVIGVEWGSWVQSSPEANRALVGEVVAAIGRGDLHPVAPTERPLAEAGAVLAELVGRQVSGRVVLVP